MSACLFTASDKGIKDSTTEDLELFASECEETIRKYWEIREIRAPNKFECDRYCGHADSLTRVYKELYLRIKKKLGAA